MITRTAHRRRLAPPLLFVHGSWHGAWCWDVHFLKFFADAGYDTYAVSLRGHGGSGGGQRLRRTRIRHYVEDVARAAGGLPASPIIIAHSMGGFIMHKYLETRTAAGVVLLAPVPRQGAFRAALRLARRTPVAFARSSLTCSMYPAVATPTLAKAAFFSPDMPADDAQTYWGRLQDESFTAFLDMLALDLPKAPVGPVPTLVVGAEKDVIFDPEQIERTAADYGVAAVWAKDVAHDAMLEGAWRNAADIILAWLNALTQASVPSPPEAG